MKIQHIHTRFNRLISTHPCPQVVVFHCGGNDIGQTFLGQIIKSLKSIFTQLIEQYPNILFIWSTILPRIKYRNEISHSKLEKIRVKINSCIGEFVIQNGGAYIQYPDLVTSRRYLFRDEVHLSNLGSEILLNTLSGGTSHLLSRTKISTHKP